MYFLCVFVGKFSNGEPLYEVAVRNEPLMGDFVAFKFNDLMTKESVMRSVKLFFEEGLL